MRNSLIRDDGLCECLFTLPQFEENNDETSDFRSNARNALVWFVRGKS